MTSSVVKANIRANHDLKTHPQHSNNQFDPHEIVRQTPLINQRAHSC